MSRRLRQFGHWLFRRHWRVTLGVIAMLLLAYAFCLPHPLFRTPYSTVLEDRQGELLGARIAADGQWRFPALDSVPVKFREAILEFEDRRFYQHPGVDPLAIGRALMQNLEAGAVVSGGSTLTMQVIRLARGDRPRNLWHKLIEAIMATRLEWSYAKEEILVLYASHAPFGGNVVGLEAATWRYFAKPPALLSWSEAATLAVLPNSPALIHPGRNREALLAKRNRLLRRLHRSGKIDTLSLELALAEALPETPHPLPRTAPHLLDRAFAQKGGAARYRSTLDQRLQQQVNSILQRHRQQLRHNGIHNIAALIVEVESGAVRAYAGNAPGAGKDHAGAVDIITAPRSTGSILKPFLYALMLQEGQLLPQMLTPDVPSTIHGFRPENFNKSFSGVVPARQALSRSLNVPMVHLLRDYGLEKFHHHLRQLGLSTITQPPDHYGLTLILGGAEASLWDLAGVYASMARTLGHYYPFDGEYDPVDFRQADYLINDQVAPSLQEKRSDNPVQLAAAPIWFTFEAMQQLERPGSEGSWEYFSSSRQLAWKTGTSYGFRDAWAIGITPTHVIAVWVGNADGEGRPGLVGVRAAAPVLFDLADLLPATPWFDPPYDEMRRLAICRQSGFRALPICPADTVWAPRNGTKVAGCPFHRLVHLDDSGSYQVDADCEAPGDIRHEPWFILPPLQEFYYRRHEPSYRSLPPVRPDCRETTSQPGSPMQLIYPRYPTRILVPTDLDGVTQRTVFTVAHRLPETTIYWHLDNQFMGSTQTFHEMELHPPVGRHRLTLVDERGHRLEREFEIIIRE